MKIKTNILLVFDYSPEEILYFDIMATNEELKVLETAHNSYLNDPQQTGGQKIAVKLIRDAISVGPECSSHEWLGRWRRKKIDIKSPVNVAKFKTLVQCGVID
jgi:hypothetical protein